VKKKWGASLKDILPELNGKDYIEKLQEDYELRFCRADEREQLVDFLRKYWRENHIFVLRPDLLDWQHLDRKNNRYNYVVAQHRKSGDFHSILGFVPTNVISSMAEGAMVPCIVFALFFGIAMGAYTKQSGNRVIVDWVQGLNAVITNIIKTVMNIAPIGIFCLLANAAGSTGLKIIIPMLKFLGLLLIGDAIQFMIFGPLTAALCKVNAAKMPKKFSKMSIMALTTTSGAICLPTKMEDAVTKFGVSRKVADFTGPITMSMNSCGAAQCYVAAIFFMAQATGIEMSVYQMGMAILLSCLMCMGTISVPGGSVIVYTFLASSLGLPLESIGVLIGIDWFAGMFRTLMNVDVDVMVGMLVASKLGELDRDIYNGKKTVTY